MLVHLIFLKIWMIVPKGLPIDKKNLLKKVNPLSKKLLKTKRKRLSKKLRALKMKSKPPPKLIDQWAVEVAEVAVVETEKVTTTGATEPEEAAVAVVVVAAEKKMSREKALKLTLPTKSSMTQMMTATSTTRLLLAQPEGTRNRQQRSRVT